AQRALPVGTIITADAIGFQLWPAEMVADAYFVEGESDMTALLGTVVRHPITAGQPLTQGSLVSPGDSGFLAAALGPGMRAVTVPVSATTGVAGFVFPGDRVDIVLTQTVTGTQGQPLNASETILRNLRVLATDQSTTQEVVEGKTVVNEVRTVTLEVTPKIAEKIAVAETIGELSLSLRSLADSQSELEQVLARGDIVIPDDATPEEEEKLLREAMARPSDARGSFATGGDVSRFQRSSIPPQTEPQSAARNLEMPQSAPGAPAPAGETRTVPRGPVVRVTRGQQTTEVPVGKSR
ncbi:MAG: Flp pilus assembly protein CpaB, partial [Alphaproteobacteria bacterium]|nr:Flp pilus assembly protein CpaB [Alphaproteobacteria bacterium]